MKRTFVCCAVLHVAGLSHGASSCLPWCSKYTCNQPAECGGCAECAPPPPPPPRSPNRHGQYGNPFASPGGWYVNPTLVTNLEGTISRAAPGTEDPKVISALEEMKRVPSAYWIDRKSKIRGHTLDTLEGILEDADKRQSPPLCAFVLYNLPNRDCNAKASNGEICCAKHADGSCDRSAPRGLEYASAPTAERAARTDRTLCASGLREYEEEYVAPFAEVLRRFDGRVPMVIILEPDSLGNVATNLGQHGCHAATARGYREGVKIAVQTLAAQAPSAALYLDAAHGGWLGFGPNVKSFVSLIGELGVAPHVRGFSTNVANYSPLGLETACPEEAYGTTGVDQFGGDGGMTDWCKSTASARGKYLSWASSRRLAVHEAWREAGGPPRLIEHSSMMDAQLAALRGGGAPANARLPSRHGPLAPYTAASYAVAHSGLAPAHDATPADTGVPACCEYDPCHLLGAGNNGATELSYVHTLQRHFQARLNWSPYFVIDTGRNGAPERRHDCASWCNIRGTGAGHVPTLNTGSPKVVDAFFWLKTPGESDGCTERLPGGAYCPRFDADCAGVDSVGARVSEPRAPEAGEWFDHHALMLAANAGLRRDRPGALDAMYNVPRPPPPPVPDAAAAHGGSLSAATRPPPVPAPPPPPPSPPREATWTRAGAGVGVAAPAAGVSVGALVGAWTEGAARARDGLAKGGGQTPALVLGSPPRAEGWVSESTMSSVAMLLGIGLMVFALVSRDPLGAARSALYSLGRKSRLSISARVALARGSWLGGGWRGGYAMARRNSAGDHDDELTMVADTITDTMTAVGTGGASDLSSVALGPSVSGLKLAPLVFSAARPRSPPEATPDATPEAESLE